MQLSDYIKKNDISVPALAKGIKVSLSTAYRYLSGERIPDVPEMERIRTFTKNKVRANDFYEGNLST